MSAMDATHARRKFAVNMFIVLLKLPQIRDTIFKLTCSGIPGGSGSLMGGIDVNAESMH
jgi:hypothetical protein